MRILFDQPTPVGIRRLLPDHIVKTAFEMSWSALTNGELLRADEEAGLEVLVTTDNNLIHQQDLKDRKIAIVVLGQARWKSIEPMLHAIVKAIEQAKPATSRVLIFRASVKPQYSESYFVTTHSPLRLSRVTERI
jgi:hypothetical protein